VTGRFVVMGVSGCGKSSIASALAARIGAGFTDGDDLHPPANIAKMAAGIPLQDTDRAPWLEAVGQHLAEAALPHVIACSALKRKYRDAIRTGAGDEVTFLHLAGSRELIAGRMAAREGHFMPATLLDSQFAALEPPEPDEAFVRVDIDQTPDAIVAELVAGIEKDKICQ
jgi:gluconokinase